MLLQFMIIFHATLNGFVHNIREFLSCNIILGVFDEGIA